MTYLPKLLLGAFLLIAAVFLYATPAFAQGPDIDEGLCVGASLDLETDPSTACEAQGDTVAQINKIIRTIINLLSVIVGVVAVIMIIVGGLRYITSGGSDTGVTSAKNTILYAIIGLIIVALAQVLVRFVLRQVTET